MQLCQWYFICVEGDASCKIRWRFAIHTTIEAHRPLLFRRLFKLFLILFEIQCCKNQIGHHQKSVTNSDLQMFMWYYFLHFCCTNLEFSTPDNFHSFVSHWNNFGTEELRWYAGEAQKGQGDIQVCLSMFSANTVLMLLQLQFERGSRKFSEIKSKGIPMVFHSPVCGKPFPAACQAGSPLVCACCAVQPDCRYLLHNPPSLCISSWGMTS